MSFTVRVVKLVVLQICKDSAGQEVEALGSGIVNQLVAL